MSSHVNFHAYIIILLTQNGNNWPALIKGAGYNIGKTNPVERGIQMASKTYMSEQIINLIKDKLLNRQIFTALPEETVSHLSAGYQG